MQICLTICKIIPFHFFRFCDEDDDVSSGNTQEGFGKTFESKSHQIAVILRDNPHDTRIPSSTEGFKLTYKSGILYFQHTYFRAWIKIYSKPLFLVGTPSQTTAAPTTAAPTTAAPTTAAPTTAAPTTAAPTTAAPPSCKNIFNGYFQQSNIT